MSRNQSQFSFSLCLQIKYIPLIQCWLHFQCQIMRSWCVFNLSHHFISTGVIGGFNFVVVVVFVIMSISVFLWSLERFSFSLIYLFFFPFFCLIWKSASVQFSSVQSLSRVQLFATPWIAARQASLSITNSRSSLRFTSIESVMPSRHLILCRPLLLLPPIPPSIRVFSNESTLRMRWPKY